MPLYDGACSQQVVVSADLVHSSVSVGVQTAAAATAVVAGRLRVAAVVCQAAACSFYLSSGNIDPYSCCGLWHSAHAKLSLHVRASAV
jgi:hypothetical protein